MTPLRAIDGGRHRILAVRYRLPEDALIPPLVAGACREADALLALGRELRWRVPVSGVSGVPGGEREWRDAKFARRGAREGLMHLRRAWIAHCCGNLALYELEAERAWAEALRHNPLMEIAGDKLLADDSRRNTLLLRNRGRNARIRRAAGATTAELAEGYGLTQRQIRNIKAGKPATKRK